MYKISSFNILPTPHQGPVFLTLIQRYNKGEFAIIYVRNIIECFNENVYWVIRKKIAALYIHIHINYSFLRVGQIFFQ